MKTLGWIMIIVPILGFLAWIVINLPQLALFMLAGFAGAFCIGTGCYIVDKHKKKP